ncbi:uncharacterized protein BXZ73DRAFT_107437 [Epithele typhae]|uniref:uncharacterized protein n=1 Tax=Epithele typhae TaxID=378194 RepID=UPI0020088F39|nr:uncharacterized protein BXZ73DRAFT_107437 [Epithele typhae]KAH9912488.1 hypothetical protein BXZ73DRAFT_107437 [Epithele typhae]
MCRSLLATWLISTYVASTFSLPLPLLAASHGLAPLSELSWHLNPEPEDSGKTHDLERRGLAQLDREVSQGQEDGVPKVTTISPSVAFNDTPLELSVRARLSLPLSFSIFLDIPSHDTHAYHAQGDSFVAVAQRFPARTLSPIRTVDIHAQVTALSTDTQALLSSSRAQHASGNVRRDGSDDSQPRTVSTGAVLGGTIPTVAFLVIAVGATSFLRRRKRRRGRKGPQDDNQSEIIEYLDSPREAPGHLYPYYYSKDASTFHEDHEASMPSSATYLISAPPSPSPSITPPPPAIVHQHHCLAHDKLPSTNSAPTSSTRFNSTSTSRSNSRPTITRTATHPPPLLLLLPPDPRRPLSAASDTAMHPLSAVTAAHPKMHRGPPRLVAVNATAADIISPASPGPHARPPSTMMDGDGDPFRRMPSPVVAPLRSGSSLGEISARAGGGTIPEATSPVATVEVLRARALEEKAKPEKGGAGGGARAHKETVTELKTEIQMLIQEVRALKSDQDILDRERETKYGIGSGM